MNIREIVNEINKIGLKKDCPFSKIQEIRRKHLNKKPRTLSPFAAYSINGNYAFHSGGREELQFNVGEDYINGKSVFRFGIAFSLIENKSLLDALGVFKDTVFRFNQFISDNSSFFNGFSSWYYTREGFGEYFKDVRPIGKNIFKADNFIFIGKYLDKEMSEVTDDDIVMILDTFDYLIPVYEKIQFGDISIEKRISRLAFNDNGWVMPSGPYGKSRDKNSHEANYGYGHEEWLLDTSKLIDGYHYGFLEPVRKGQDTYAGKNYDIWLYTIDGVSKSRCWVGEIKSLEVITPDKANDIKSIYKKNGWLKEMEEQIIASGANNHGFSDWEGIDLFNVRYKPQNLIVNDPYYELPSDHPIIDLSRYTFAHFKDDFTIAKSEADSDTFSFNPDVDGIEEDNNIKVETSTYKRESKSIEITHLHKDISSQLTRVLKEKYGNLQVKAEHSSGIGANKIDIVVNSETDGLIFYEIKTYNSVKTSIREALGQLLEYSMWPDKTKAKQLVILTQKHNDIEDVKTYFKHLREKLGLSIYYQWLDMGTKKLSEKY